MGIRGSGNKDSTGKRIGHAKSTSQVRRATLLGTGEIESENQQEMREPAIIIIIYNRESTTTTIATIERARAPQLPCLSLFSFLFLFNSIEIGTEKEAKIEGKKELQSSWLIHSAPVPKADGARYERELPAYFTLHSIASLAPQVLWTVHFAPYGCPLTTTLEHRDSGV